jgi:hypothetical protein
MVVEPNESAIPSDRIGTFVSPTSFPCRRHGSDIRPFGVSCRQQEQHAPVLGRGHSSNVAAHGQREVAQGCAIREGENDNRTTIARNKHVRMQDAQVDTRARMERYFPAPLCLKIILFHGRGTVGIKNAKTVETTSHAQWESRKDQ